MIKKLSIILIIAIAFTLTSCENRSDITAPKADVGQTDFSSFVTIGNSITAGYQSDALFQSAQENCYGAIIARQVGTRYEIPYVSDPGVSTSGRMEVQALNLATGSITIVNNSLRGTPTNSTYSAAYNNLGIPGATLYDVLNAKNSNTCLSGINGSQNTMFDLVLRGKGTQFQQAKSLKPTFLILWIGNNDILGHATAGGTIPYTPTNTFSALYSQLADSIKSLNCKVALVNIPDVTSIPFFTTVPAIHPVTKTPMYGVTAAGIRQLVYKKDLVTLKAQALIAQGYGVSADKPLPSSVVLDSVEVETAKQVVASYNSTIQATATAKGFALVDINAVMREVALAGKVYNGVKFTSAYITGNLFSLDGVHPTSQGQAVIANEIIGAVNSKWNANIAKVNVSNIKGSLILTKSANNNQNLIPIFSNNAFNKMLF